jgi:heme/copper-type cytochrome/quinol oxidase subunit 2
MYPQGKPIQLDITLAGCESQFFICHILDLNLMHSQTKITCSGFNLMRQGVYDIACAEYCGLNHWNMYTKVHIVPQPVFDEWLSNKKALKDGGTVPVVDSNAVKKDTIAAPADTAKKSDGNKKK